MSGQDPPFTDRGPGWREMNNEGRISGMEMIHVVFSNDGSVKKISGCPDGVGGQDWFNFLSRKTRDRYESLSGGRGVFRLEPGDVEYLAREASGIRK